MAEVLFYEKPGCINNTKQKNILAEAGHQVEARSLLEHNWTQEELRSYFSGLEVKDWINRAAPSVKSGEIIPEQMTEETALASMMENRLLIRRPLIQIGETRMCGFNLDQIDEAIGLLQEHKENISQKEIEECPSTTKSC